MCPEQKSLMFQAIEVHSWYNRRKENDEKGAKTLRMEGGYVSLQQRADPSGGFREAIWHESEGKQPLGEKSAENPVAGD